MEKKKVPASELKNIKKTTVEKIGTLMISAFGLIAALAWNGAIQSLFAQIFGTQSGIVALFMYAIVVTFIAVVLTIYLSRLLARINT